MFHRLNFERYLMHFRSTGGFAWQTGQFWDSVLRGGLDVLPDWFRGQGLKPQSPLSANGVVNKLWPSVSGSVDADSRPLSDPFRKN